MVSVNLDYLYKLSDLLFLNEGSNLTTWTATLQQRGWDLSKYLYFDKPFDAFDEPFDKPFDAFDKPFDKPFMLKSFDAFIR